MLHHHSSDSLPSKSRRTISSKQGPVVEKRSVKDSKKIRDHRNMSPRDMSPRSSMDIDCVGNIKKSNSKRHIILKAPRKRVSFSTCETIPNSTDEYTEATTEETVLTSKEEIGYDYDEEHDHEEFDNNPVAVDHDDDYLYLNNSNGHNFFDEAPTQATLPVKRKVRRRKIRWSGHVRVQEIKHLNNMSESEKDAIWMSAMEYKNIKDKAKTTVMMMMSGKIIDEDDPNFSTRGLEFRTRAGSKIRSQNKLRARSAVLNEQDLQREEGFYDPEFIAMASMDVSIECREDAQERGEKDAQSIRSYVSKIPQEVNVVLF